MGVDEFFGQPSARRNLEFEWALGRGRSAHFSEWLMQQGAMAARHRSLVLGAGWARALLLGVLAAAGVEKYFVQGQTRSTPTILFRRRPACLRSLQRSPVLFLRAAPHVSTRFSTTHRVI